MLTTERERLFLNEMRHRLRRVPDTSSTRIAAWLHGNGDKLALAILAAICASSVVALLVVLLGGA